MAQGLPCDSEEDKDPKRRINLEAPPDEKLPGRDETELLVLAKKKARHQESAQHKEEIDSNPSSLKPDGSDRVKKAVDVRGANFHMPADHQKHSKCSQDIYGFGTRHWFGTE